MFDTIVSPSSGVPRPRWTTTALSAVAHLAIVTALVLSTIYATGGLPVPREIITFVSVAPPPPPPPAVLEPVEAAKPSVVRKAAPLRSTAAVSRVRVAAPVEAPNAIAPETGREGGEFEPVSIEAGFERGLSGGIAGGIVGGFETALSPPPAAAPAEPLRVGGAIDAPRLSYRVEPDYPPIAVSAQIEGTVILEATVDETGVVRDARVLRSRGVLDAPAVRAVEQWRYEPLLFNGQPTPFVLTVTVTFSLAR
jgi:protein TonB